MAEFEAQQDAHRQWEAPASWPTNRGSGEFWEELGRTVATFGMLEDSLARTFYVVSGQREAEAEERREVQMHRWIEEVVQALRCPLRGVADRLGAEWRRQEADGLDLKERMIQEVNSLAERRNAVCHGAWVGVEEGNANTLRYFARGQDLPENYQTRWSIEDLRAIRMRARDIIKDLIEVVRADYGLDFPGAQ